MLEVMLMAQLNSTPTHCEHLTASFMSQRAGDTNSCAWEREYAIDICTQARRFGYSNVVKQYRRTVNEEVKKGWLRHFYLKRTNIRLKAARLFHCPNLSVK
jgi:hypothetical protein